MAQKLSPPQLVGLAARVGFPDPRLAASVALAESSGDVGIRNRQGSGAAGLFQILPSAHPEYDVNRLLSDPVYNARAAFAISGGGKTWQPWQAYTNGSYRQYLPAVQDAGAAAAAPLTPAPAAPAPTGRTPVVASGQGSQTGGHDPFVSAFRTAAAGRPARAARPSAPAGDFVSAFRTAASLPPAPASQAGPLPLPQPRTVTSPPARGYPLAAPGRVIGVPYQGTHTLYGNWESDNAVDVATPVGTPVVALSDGVIGSQIGPLQTGGDPHLLGLRVHLVTPGNEYYYAHLSRLAVKAGQRVKAGQIIGYSGSANGVAHLHLGEKNGNPLKIVGGARS